MSLNCGLPSQGNSQHRLATLADMARAENDTWDLATSVGATATMVAAGRGRATRAGLIDDPFAEPLVRAVGVDFFFFEMDVWMLRSPMAAARQNSTVDMMLALHQVRFVTAMKHIANHGIDEYAVVEIPENRP